MGTNSRRQALLSAVGVAVGASLLIPGCSKAEEADVSATEDLMREHGVLRRILVIYRETAVRLRQGVGGLDVPALGQAASLFRTFGEDYHEQKLEEQHIFPALKRRGGEAAALIDTLLAQHDRGRETTAFIQSVCGTGRLGVADAEPLARALESFARMYEAHTAFEDTIVFQAWKASLSEQQLKEAGERFEDIEKAQFKGDGFDMAVEQVRAIEQRLGLADLGRYTMARPGAG